MIASLAVELVNIARDDISILGLRADLNVPDNCLAGRQGKESGFGRSL
jgi:hypothetical protein